MNLLKGILFLGVGLTILYFVYTKYDAAYQAQCKLDGIAKENCDLIQKIVDDFKSVNFFWIFIVLIAFTISNWSRALRWKMLIKPLGYEPKTSNAFLTIIIGYFANLGLPRIGEVVRAATMSRYEKIPTEKLLGTIVVGRVVDVICFATAIGLAVILEYNTIMEYLSKHQGATDSGATGDSGMGLLFYGGIAFAVLGVLFFVFRKAFLKTAFFQKVIDFLKGLWEGIQSVRKLDKPWLFVMHSINIWIMYYLMTYLCFFAFGPTSDLSPLAGLMAFVFGALGIVIPSPGGMGTYHFFTSEALMMYGTSAGNAFSFANILFFSIQVGCNVLIGILALILLPILNRGYEPKPRKEV